MLRALTIHKSQGQTIERVKIDLNKIFVEGKLNLFRSEKADQKGQTYVAISRAVSLETLEIRGFSSNKCVIHPHFQNDVGRQY
jgi:ATP-dependent DNA helicase PIF1